jgi:hypothetical protein
MRKYVILALLVLCLGLFPVFATEDLYLYTAGGGYVTPSYGNFLGGYYYYYNEGHQWMVNSVDNFEALGYYKIFNNANSILTVSGTVVSSFEGTIKLCVEGGDYGINRTAICTSITRYDIADIGSEKAFLGTYDLQTYGVISGICRYWLVFAMDNGLSQSSWHYNFYYNPDDAWSREKIISLTSTNNVSSGVITLTFNSTDSADFTTTDIQYDNDGNEQTLSGTFSNLLITSSDKTKAYPYYIESFRGGFYNYSRNTSNTTVIKVFVNENVTSKGLILFFNYTKNNLSNQGLYNKAHNDSSVHRSDDNNNPFVIHQVFSDWRWNESFYKNVLSIRNTSKYAYTRNISLNITQTNQIETDAFRYMSNVSEIYWSHSNTGQGYGNYGGSYLFGDWLIVRNGNGGVSSCGLELINSTGTAINSNSCVGTRILSVKFNDTNLTLYQSNIKINHLTEIETRLGNISQIGIQTYYATSTSPRFFYYLTKTNISTTNTISATTNTSFVQASIIFTPNNPTRTFTNSFTLSGQISSASAGTVTCSLSTGEVIGSLSIPDISVFSGNGYAGLYDFAFAYVYPYANFTNLTNFTYSCVFTSLGSSLNTSTMGLYIEDDRLFISGIYPAAYTNYQVYTIPLRANSINLYNNSGNPYYLIPDSRRCDCLLQYNGICYKYDLSNCVVSVGASNPIYIPLYAVVDWFLGLIGLYGNQITNPTNYTDNLDLFSTSDNKCFLTTYVYNISNYSYTSSLIIPYCLKGNTTTGNTTNSPIPGIDTCIVNTYCPYDSVICSFPITGNGNWYGVANWYNETQPTSCINAKMREDPLRFFSSTIYQTQILGKDELGNFIYGVVFTVIFNFWFLVFAIGVSSLITFRIWQLSAILMWGATYLFSYAGWLGILSPTLLVGLTIIGLFIFMIKQH